MNRQQYETAVWRLLERESEDPVVEVMLVCGMAPSSRHNDKLVDDVLRWSRWRQDVDHFLLDRWGWKSPHQRKVAGDVIARRMFDLEYQANEQKQSEAD